MASTDKGISHSMRHHAQDIKWGEGGRRRDVWSDGICLPSHHYKQWSPAFLGMAAHPTGQGTW